MDTDWAKIIFTDESFFWLPAAVERYGVGRFIHNVLIIPVNGCLLAQRFGQFIFYKKLLDLKLMHLCQLGFLKFACRLYHKNNLDLVPQEEKDTNYRSTA